jgi:hypothetical protein
MRIDAFFSFTAKVSLITALTSTLSLAVPGLALASQTPGQDCALRTILLAAKKNVAAKYGNSPNSHGYCAMGVRTSLQESGVGNVDGSLGNAIDYLHSLPPHGFVQADHRDPRSAAPGSVLVFSGPHTPQYLRDGHFGSPAGDWLGHVTIKGDDGRYYTDGRTAEPAIGWQNGVNVAHRRNIEGSLVPDSALASRYAGSCKGMEAEEQAVAIQLGAEEIRMMPQEDSASRAAAAALVTEGLGLLARGDSPQAFHQALGLAREALAYDDEGMLLQELAGMLARHPSYEHELARFYAALPQEKDASAQCKTEVFQASLERTLCLESERHGQDSTAESCPAELSWSNCLAKNAAAGN